MADTRRIAAYDVLKCLAAFGVVIWHLGPLSAGYVVWAVAAFVFTTWALRRDRGITPRKVFLTLLNIAVVCLVTLGLAIPILGTELIRPMLRHLSFSPRSLYELVFHNPYLGPIWYLLLHFQFLLLFLWLGDRARRWNRGHVLVLAFVISQVWVFGLYYLVQDYLGIFFPSWLLLGVVALYWGRELAQFAKSLPPWLQAFMTASAIGLSALVMANRFAAEYFAAFRDYQFFMVQTYVLFVFLAIFCFSALIDRYAPWLARVLAFCGRYSLVIYVSHMFFGRLYERLFGPSPVRFLLVFAVCVLYGHVFQKAYDAVLGAVLRKRGRPTQADPRVRPGP